ncbi:MAG TPA: DUF502 domain-containing protein [Rhizomicrobium sp.]|nr:DUF502 domain-containing protein [Rhizomicrobium sp.]
MLGRGVEKAMAENPTKRNPFTFQLRGNLIAGVLALAPLAAVWLVLRVLLDALYEAGQPLAAPLAAEIGARMPRLVPILSNGAVLSAFAVFLALAVIYAVGLVTSRVAGRRLVALVERVIARIPLVETVYSAVKKLADVLQRHPGAVSRVVLIAFPHSEARAIGLLTRSFQDAKTGEALAAVLVPTAPNPTTGYLQIVPMRALTPTDLSLDQAMSMLFSGGSNAPENFTLERM